MKNHAKAGFKNTSHDQAAYGESTDGPPLFRVSLQREFEGDLVGSSTAELLTCQISKERFSYVGTDRFTGKLRDRSGSFVFQHGGKHENGSLQPFGYIVPGSATGELHGLFGDVKISVAATGEHSVELDYDFQ